MSLRRGNRAMRLGQAYQSMSAVPHSPLLHLPDQARASELKDVLEQAAPHIKVLSLDCFDTIVWRRTRAPVDVFFTLAQHPVFLRWGINARLRVKAESDARSLKRVTDGSSEVVLAEIYRAAFPNLTDEQVSELSLAELEAEKHACYALPRVVELIRLAKQKGLQVVVASDTYLRKPQLRELLKSCLPQDVYDNIDHVFCSCEIGKSKVQGMLSSVLLSLQVEAKQVLHIGDNVLADVKAPKKLGISCVHFHHYDEYADEVLRMNASALSLLSPEARGSEPLSSPFHPFFAQAADDGQGARRLGYFGLGPIFYGFAEFIRAEIERLHRQGCCPKPVFLMRDAHLPLLAYRRLSTEEEGLPISISRFVAYAASFRSLADIDRYLARSAGAARYDAMLKQLLLNDGQCKTILKRVTGSRHPQHEFVLQVRQPLVVKEIIEASTEYRKRLYRYLERTVDLKQGDTLLFVDLGYEGTAQRELSAVFMEEKNVTLRGCYLIAARVPDWQDDRVGLIDPSWSDDRVAASLIPYVAVLEDLCTTELPSVLDYTEGGEPIFAEAVIAKEQFERVRHVQRHCLSFIEDAKVFFDAAQVVIPPSELRSAAMASIARLLFLPTQAEVDYLDGFQLDMNLGTTDTFALFDREKGMDGLRRRGLFFMEKNLKSLRMNYPIELRAAGLELSMTLLAQHRYGFDFSLQDLNQRMVKVQVLALRGTEASELSLSAQATHDGYFSLYVPVGACDYDIGILFGRNHRMIQLLSADLIPIDKLYTEDESTETKDVLSYVSYESVTCIAGGVLDCADKAGFVFISPKRCCTVTAGDGRIYVLRIVFRPLCASQP